MQITNGVRSIGQRKGGRVHCYLIDSGEGLTLIDTGYEEDAEFILKELEIIQRPATDIKRILLTHSHKSHISGLATIAKMSGAPVYAHEWEIGIIQGERKAEKVGYDRPKPFNLEVYALQVGLNLGVGKHTPWHVDGRLKDGDTAGPLQVMSVPGHTPGSLAFWWPEQRVLITGDTVASWPQVDRGWRSFDLDEAAAKRSAGKMAELSSAEVLCVGHGNPITEGASDVLKLIAT
jgi:glyoxylase-like metal-dependent hydrolase (beta-lactamase superfamily II)